MSIILNKTDCTRKYEVRYGTIYTEHYDTSRIFLRDSETHPIK